MRKARLRGGGRALPATGEAIALKHSVGLEAAPIAIDALCSPP